MSLTAVFVPEKSRLRALLEHFAEIEDPRQQSWRVAYPLPEVLLLVVCGTIADCDDDDGIAAWGEARLPFLRRFLPYHHGVPCARWLTLLMNRIDPNLFSAAFTAWVRQTWPDRLDLVAIDGKTSRRSHDRSADRGPLHLVSAFATTQRLVLGQEAVADKTNEITAIPLLIERLAADDRLKGALVSIDAIATNPIIATAIKDAKADYLLAVKANQPTLRTEIETFFADAPPASLESVSEVDKGHGPDRATHRHRLPRARLARRRAPLSGRAPSTGRSHHHPCRIASRACRSRSLRDPIRQTSAAVHLAIASDKARFAKPEINLGMPPTFGGTQRLPRLAGRKRALELLLTGDPFPPARALEIGLVNMIVPNDELLPAAHELARRIIRHSPLAVGSVITAVTRGLNMAIGEGLQIESEQFAAMVPTHDLGEGLAAWIEHRPPSYSGQ
jgi:predicted transposase YbfD/YdcC